MSDSALMPMDAIAGAAVAGADGATLGTIAEVMIDVTTGAIAYAVLSYGGVMGVGEKLFAVPWRCFAVDPVASTLTLPIDRERFDAAEGFDKDAWPSAGDEEWLRARQCSSS